jgi:adenylosuccinate lyase
MEKNMDNLVINLNLTATEVNFILMNLYKLPYEQVHELIRKITAESQQQINEEVQKNQNFTMNTEDQNEAERHRAGRKPR